MATSAATLQTIITTITAKHSLDEAELKQLLGSKGLLPKKLLEQPKAVKAVSTFASKAATEFAATNKISAADLAKIPPTGANGKLTIKDLKGALEAPVKKVNASPSALKYVRDNGLDISRIAKGSGDQGKILLSDVKDLHDPDSSGDESDEDEIKVSPAVAKLMKQHDLDNDDLEGVVGTGDKGKILVKDIKELLKELDAEK